MLLYEEILYEYIEFKNPKKKTEKGKILEIIYAKLIRVISKIKNLCGFVKKLGLLNCILLFISKAKQFLLDGGFFCMIVIFAALNAILVFQFNIDMPIETAAIITIIIFFILVCIYKPINHQITHQETINYIENFIKTFITTNNKERIWDIEENIDDLINWCEEESLKKPAWYNDLCLPEKPIWSFIMLVGGYAILLIDSGKSEKIEFGASVIILLAILYMITYMLKPLLYPLLFSRATAARALANDLKCAKLILAAKKKDHNTGFCENQNTKKQQ